MNHQGAYVLHGRVFTAVGSQEGQERGWVGVADGLISYVGAVDPRGREMPADTPVLDVGERTMFPGFLDGHSHVELSSDMTHVFVDVRYPKHKSIADVLESMRENLWKAEETGWLVAWGGPFLERFLSDQRFPTRAELDSVSTTVPIVIRISHTAILNTPAIALANLERFTAGGQGTTGVAYVERDEQGEPTGLVKEITAFLPIPRPSPEKLRENIKGALETRYLANGVTTVGNITDSKRGLDAVVELADTGRLGPRVEALVWVPSAFGKIGDAQEWIAQNQTGHGDKLRVSGIKVFADGGISAAGAATLTPYSDDFALAGHEHGQMSLTMDQMVDYAVSTAKLGLHLVVHAAGEVAQRQLADAIVIARRTVPDLKVRAEHAGNLLTEWETADAWRSAGIIPVPNPGFLYVMGDFIPLLLGDAGGSGQFPFRRLLDEGWELGVGSDDPAGSVRGSDPMFDIWCCVKRESALGNPVETDQAITVAEALLMRTRYTAQALGVLDTRGTIEVGKYADLVLTDRDPREVAVDEIRDVQIDHVIVGGVCEYVRDGAAPMVELGQS